MFGLGAQELLCCGAILVPIVLVVVLLATRSSGRKRPRSDEPEDWAER